ncbi:uncharacterized protein LOC113301929 [Papaver somniferum]|uniref:uncharacterized protein LOC113301929 n=1 Tax=Papaver somniferum TaxID=3469 RepID=UPI000E6FE5CD|nr:uncharacterized protein LOC113301929 [Papaver somniferum]
MLLLYDSSSLIILMDCEMKNVCNTSNYKIFFLGGTAMVVIDASMLYLIKWSSNAEVHCGPTSLEFHMPMGPVLFVVKGSEQKQYLMEMVKFHAYMNDSICKRNEVLDESTYLSRKLHLRDYDYLPVDRQFVMVHFSFW